MSASVLMSRENLPLSSTNQDAAALEPPSKQARLLEQPCSFKVKLLNEHAKPPQRGSEAAAGYDLFRCDHRIAGLNFCRSCCMHLHSAFSRVAVRRPQSNQIAVLACSSEDTVIPARGRKLVKTGIAIHTPPGTYGRVAPRSGLAVNHFIDVGAGVIDEDYRGEVRVLLFNHEGQDFTGTLGV
jgi:dUTPase